MRRTIMATYITKYNHPMAAYIEDNDCTADEDWGHVMDLGIWIGRYGRHVLVEDDRGFVEWVKLTRDEADSFDQWVLDNYPQAMGTTEEDQ